MLILFNVLLPLFLLDHDTIHVASQLLKQYSALKGHRQITVYSAADTETADDNHKIPSHLLIALTCKLMT
jgi:hypothetical protein